MDVFWVRILIAFPVLGSCQEKAPSLLPILEIEDGIEEESSTDIKCSFPETNLLKVDLKIIHKNSTLQDCKQIDKLSPNITCTAEFAKHDHNTDIRCEAHVVIKSKPRTIHILLDPTFTDCPENVTWVEGEENKFNCKAMGYPSPNVTCQRNRKVYREGEKFIAMRNMSGDYTCTALSTDKVTKTVVVRVLYKPKIVKPNISSVLLVNQGDNFTLTCEAEGVPAPTYNWVTPTTDLQLSSDNQTLTVYGTELKHQGSYVCKATNVVGENTSTQNITVKGLNSGHLSEPAHWTIVFTLLCSSLIYYLH